MVQWLTRATWLCLFLAVAAGEAACAERRGSTSDAEAARRRLPLEILKGPHAAAVRETVAKPLFYRRGPIEVFPCEPKLLQWLFDHPLWAAEYWRQLGMEVTPLQLLDDGYECREKDRGRISFHVAYDSPDMRIIRCVGEMTHPLAPGVLRAEMVLVHRYRFSRSSDGTYYVAQQLETFVTAKGLPLKTVMKLTHATCEELIDRSLQEMMVYFSVLCRIIQLRPRWTLETLEKLRDQFPAEEVEALATILKGMPPLPDNIPGLPPGFAETPATSSPEKAPSGRPISESR